MLQKEGQQVIANWVFYKTKLPNMQEEVVISSMNQEAASDILQLASINITTTSTILQHIEKNISIQDNHKLIDK